VLVAGIVIVAGHNLLDPIQASSLGAWRPAWLLLHERGMILRDGIPVVAVYYPALPWLGVMALGYGLGPLFVSSRRNRWLVSLGIGMLALFVVLRVFNVYGDPRPWTAQATTGQTLMAIFNVEKYPPSLLYVCATLGPMLLLVPLFERLRGPAPVVLRTYGSVPLMAYVSHLYVMHLLAIAARVATGQKLDGMFNTVHVFFLTPNALAGTGFPLAVTYVAWVVVLAIIYPLCRWWSDVKRRRRDWWLSYL